LSDQREARQKHNDPNIAVARPKRIARLHGKGKGLWLEQKVGHNSGCFVVESFAQPIRYPFKAFFE